jgi:hypothetical protein
MAGPSVIDAAAQPTLAKTPGAQTSFTRHRYELPMLWVFFAIALVELFAVHLLVSLWSGTAAWLLSAATIVALGQIGLLIHGLVKWPTLIDGRSVVVRHGRRGEIVVPLSRIAAVEDVAFRPEEKGAHVFRATLLAQPNLAIRLSEPLRHGRKLLQCITLRLDDPDRFHAALIDRNLRA